MTTRVCVICKRRLRDLQEVVEVRLNYEMNRGEVILRDTGKVIHLTCLMKGLTVSTD